MPIDTIIYAVHSLESGIFHQSLAAKSCLAKRRLLQGQDPRDIQGFWPKLHSLDGGHYGGIGVRWVERVGQACLKEKGTEEKCQQTILANEMTTNVIQ